MLAGPVFRRLAGEIIKQGRCEVQERLGDLSIGIRRASVHLALRAPNSLFRLTWINPIPFSRSLHIVRRVLMPNSVEDPSTVELEHI